MPTQLSAQQQEILKNISGTISKISEKVQAGDFGQDDSFVADASKVGRQNLNIPVATNEGRRVVPEIEQVGTTNIPKTSLGRARETLLEFVPEEDRATINSILDLSTNLQTERGQELEGDLNALTDDRLELANLRRDRKRESVRLQEEARLPELESELEAIRGEADVLKARRNDAIQREERREGVSTNARNLNVADIERDFDLRQANLAIRELAAVGKVNAATRLIETKLDLKYGDLEAETELVKAQIEAILPLLSREDAKVAETRLLLNEQVKTTIADAREADKVLEEFKLQSYINAQANGASSLVLGQIMSAESREDVASIGGNFIESPDTLLSREATRASIRSSNIAAQKAQYELDLLKNPPETGLDTQTKEAIDDLDNTQREDLNNARTTIDQLDQMIALVNSSDDLTLLNPGTKAGRLFNQLAEDVADKLARERTGAVVGKSEQKSFKKILGIGFFNQLASDDEEIVAALNRMKTVHQNTVSLVDPTGGITSFLDSQSLGQDDLAEINALFESGTAGDAVNDYSAFFGGGNPF